MTLVEMAEQLRTEAESQGLSCSALAKKAGLSSSTVRRVLAASVDSMVSSVAVVAAALGLRLEVVVSAKTEDQLICRANRLLEKAGEKPAKERYAEMAAAGIVKNHKSESKKRVDR